ncbi:PAX3- and PAX7-binding protein 1 [Nilaparvata lugens]|uniref:PAX3- and PAX7-binding protein 1 n=1 Tax=Nilaparvata lugens TaxID=108931 RepID=UPI00193E08FF|nr:PAX3- and PAX7-binding protein 1 [Nilaparvata lugens]
MATFKKPKRNLRKRGELGFSDENDSEDKSNSSDGFSFVKKPDKKLKKELTKTSVLSFGEELDEGDDGEIFQVKKSSHSKKIRKQLDKEKKKKKDAKSDDSKDNKTNVKEILVDDEITIKIKNPINVPKVLNGREALATLSESSDEEEGATKHGTMRHKFSHSDQMKQLLRRGCIPDAAMIHAVRKRRQEARELGVEYIPLNENNGQEKESKTDMMNANSRLVREDDEGSDDEEKIIKMSVHSAVADKERRREAFAAAQDDQYEQGHDDVDKDDEWEKQQIRKGVTGAQLVAVQQENFYYQQFMMQQTSAPSSISNMAAAQPEIPPTTITTTSFPTHPPTDANTAIDPPSVVKKMKDRLADMKEVHRRHYLDCDSMRREMEALSLERERLREDGPRLADKFRFYQDLRGYVTDLVECLDEKVVILLALEQRLLSIYKKRCTDLMARRRQDVKDQAEELATSASKPSMRDEERVRRAAEREGRRIRRMRLREQKAVTNGGKHMDGMSSDDEVTEMEAAAFRTQKETVEQDAKHVFEDALDDFATVGGILERFESWKETDLDAYTEAYVNLCLPKVLGPLIRLNILMWNPLSQAGNDLERTAWYVSLLNYGIKNSETEDSLKSDPDLQLIPRVFEKIIVPKLNQLVDASYDPISTSQSLSLVQIVSNLIQLYPTLSAESKNLNTLLNTIVLKLRNSIENDVFIPIFPKQMMEGRMNYFFQRQFAMAVKLLSNIVRWQGIVSDEIIFELALDSLLNRYLLLAIRISEPFQAAVKCYMVSSALPKVWLQPDNTPKQLKSLIDQANTISEQLDQTRPLARDAVDKLSCLLRLVT